MLCVLIRIAKEGGDYNEYAQYTAFNIKKKLKLNHPKSAVKEFFLGTHEQVPNSHGKRAISVGATEVLLYNESNH